MQQDSKQSARSSPGIMVASNTSKLLSFVHDMPVLTATGKRKQLFHICSTWL